MKTTPDLRSRFALVAVALAVSGTITGCGGGSSDNAAPPASTALALSGTATDGSANPIASRAIDAKCSTGSGATTTNGSGSFTLSIDGAKLPCVARVTKADGSVLHTVATGSGTSATTNITPATQLIVANLAGTDPRGVLRHRVCRNAADGRGGQRFAGRRGRDAQIRRRRLHSRRRSDRHGPDAWLHASACQPVEHTRRSRWR